jgi:hypothetical protein
LLQEISESRPEYLTKPFTVAEIYQNLVPYRSHRDLIGVEMNGDYEDILLRLLAGEGDYLLLDSEVARREIREELESNNPNTGLFRDFAAADVRLNPDRVPAEVSETRDVAGETLETEALETEALDEEAPPPPVDSVPEEPEAIDIAELRPEDDDAGGGGGWDGAEDDETGSDGVIGHIEGADVGFLVPLPGAEANEVGSQNEETSEVTGVEDTPAPVAEEPDGSEEFVVFAESEPSGELKLSTEPEHFGESDEFHESEQQSGEPDGSPASDESGNTPDLVASEEGDESACHWCRQNLPSRELLNFCPFCGSELRLFPCPKCGEELEPRWQFCVSCGTDVSE